MLTLAVAPHPELYAAAFVTRLREPLESCDASRFGAALRLDFAAPVQRSDELRTQVRDLLRHGGYKPTGRGKPASEYLVQAAERGTLGSINFAVDACNVASLHSGLPISVVDIDRAAAPFRIAIAGDEQYVFNASGQVIDIEGLLCLFDAQGPCANAVKDSQRTKTHGGTLRTLSVVWGPAKARALVDKATDWYRALLADGGAAIDDVEIETTGA